jgi:hypothetical protein
VSVCHRFIPHDGVSATTRVFHPRWQSTSPHFPSLATHLDNPQIAEMAIAKVVETISDGSAQTALILSFQHAIILEIDKSCQPTAVK